MCFYEALCFKVFTENASTVSRAHSQEDREKVCVREKEASCSVLGLYRSTVHNTGTVSLPLCLKTT